MNRFLAIGLLLTTTYLNAEPITLKDSNQIQRAHALSLAIDNISEKVMACMDEPGSTREVCACFNLDSCKFKKEFDKAAALYCAINTDFPSWSGKSINYSVKGKNGSHALSMAGLERQFGKYCK